MLFNNGKWNIVESNSSGWNENNQRVKLTETVGQILKDFYNCDFIFESPLSISALSTKKCTDDNLQNPCTCPDRKHICISSIGTSWCQYIYQLSHELCHNITSRRTLLQKVKWFDEFLCCFTSYFVLSQIAAGKYDLSYAYNDYKTIILNYRNGKQDGHIYECNNMKNWFAEYRTKYENEQNLIKSHDFFHIKFYRLLNDNYKGLSFIGKLHDLELSADCVVENQIEALMPNLNYEEEKVVKIITDMFGLQIKEQTNG